ncbi:STAS domain-containing protein [Streptosporangium amethystogenes subsp. fukuiense]|uniref:STAS domain-containing protein n=1 Tax=Streptosporangium amethystogenes subsp. fukuiense TaxID=698418 RepID=A0ABW2T986_9ACTN
MHHDEYTVLQVRGKFTQDTTPAALLQGEIVSLSVDGPPRLVLDLGGVTTWDDDGVGAVIGAAKRVMTARGKLVIAATPADLMERFQRQGLDQRLKLRETVEQAANEFDVSR